MTPTPGGQRTRRGAGVSSKLIYNSPETMPHGAAILIERFAIHPSLIPCKEPLLLLRPLSFEQLLARAEPQQTQPNLHQNSTGPAFHALDTAGGKTLTIIGGGLMTLGIILAATAGDTATITFTDPFSGATTVIEASTVSNARRWGGVGLAGAGGLLVWRGLSNTD